MNLLDAHGRAMEEFDARVRQVRSAQWDAPTPCTQWTVHDLVNHLVTEQLWAPWLLRGATLEEVGDRFDGDQLGDDPLRAWTDASRRARAAWLEPSVTKRNVNVSSGRISAQEYGWQMTTDLAVHAWDLAKGIGADERIDPELAETVLDTVVPRVPRWQGLGIFAPSVPATADDDVQARLVRLLGREP